MFGARRLLLKPPHKMRAARPLIFDIWMIPLFEGLWWVNCRSTVIQRKAGSEGGAPPRGYAAGGNVRTGIAAVAGEACLARPMPAAVAKRVGRAGDNLASVA